MKYAWLLLVNILSFAAVQAQGAREVNEKMLKAIGGVSSLKYRLKTYERIGNSYRSSEQDVRYAKNPFRFYIYSYKPDKGAEVLYNPQANKKEVLVNPGAFPYINLYLNPYSSILRKNRHHTSFDVGFDYFAAIVSYLMKQGGTEIDKGMRLEGDVKYNNRDCYKLVMDYPGYKHLNYTVKNGETVTSIANRYFVSDYKILELNKEIDDYNDLKPGQVIKIPNLYAKRVLIYIDKKTFLPIMQEMHDERGLYERFEFLDLQLNPTFPQGEFTKDFKQYHF